MKYLVVVLAACLVALALMSSTTGQEAPPGAAPDWDIFPDPSPVTAPPGAEPDWDIFDDSEYEPVCLLRYCETPEVDVVEPTPEPTPVPTLAPTPTPCTCECDP